MDVNSLNIRSGDSSAVKPFPIVAIGASAGGTAAMTELLQHLPVDTGMAYIYIQHLDRDYESNLAAILSRATRMNVYLGEDKTRIGPDSLYVIPPSKEMTIEGGIISVTPRPDDTPVHMPVDRLFISLAEKHKEAVIGIVLSGSASDGTIGMKAIKVAGGLTFAQDNTAQFKSMPNSAIAEGTVDLVLSPKEIAEELVRFSRQVNILEPARKFNEDQEIVERDEDLSDIIRIIRKSTGVDFEHYKITTIRRRIIRRMLLYKLGSVKEYMQYIRQHTDEAAKLYSDLLINVTTFFRDPEAIRFLQKTLIPRILQYKAPNGPLRIWVPACATGEEAYTIAMTLMEVLGDKANTMAIQIFATDLSEVAINKARLGIYSSSEVSNINTERLLRFFTKMDGHYRIAKSIRDLCVFAAHNIFKDPPFSKLDLVSCCNLLIYLDTVLQRKIMHTFHYALDENGYLMLGKSETVGSSLNLFTHLDGKIKVYARKRDAVSRTSFEMPFRLPVPEHVRMEGVPNRKPDGRYHNNSFNLEKVIDNIFLTQYTPPSVVINKDLNIVQFRGATNAFLAPAPGPASFNILKMVSAGLAIALRDAIHKCFKTDEPVTMNGQKIQRNNNEQQVSIELLPLKVSEHDRLLLVIFKEVNITDADTQPADVRVRQLEAELISLREDMRSLLEEQEAANEQLQSVNEEIVSSKKELQSSNEELETSKEEIESTNEELMTINAELMVRNDQLAESHQYTEAVIATIREAVIIMDNDLRVRSANKAFCRMFRLAEEDILGLQIFEIAGNQWNIPKLRELLEVAIPIHAMFQGVEITHTFPNIGKKVLLLDGIEIIQQSHQLQTIILSIEDITDHCNNERLIAEREAWFRNMADNVPVMIWVADAGRQMSYVNKTWLEYTGRLLAQDVASGWLESIHHDDVGSYLQKYTACFDQRIPFRTDYRMKRYNGEYRWMVSTAMPTYNAFGEFTGYTGSAVEIHNEKLMNEELERRVQERTRELQDANNNLERSNHELEQFAYVASHDLQEPLRKILTFSDRLEDQYKEQLTRQGRDYLAKIIASSNRMTQLIDDLLDFSRINQSKKGFVETDLNEVMHELIIDFEVSVKEKEAEVMLEQPLPVLRANRLQMRQLFHNLLSNALKFSSLDRKPEIIISSRRIPRDEVNNSKFRLTRGCVYYEITFRDNGIGFNQEYAEQVFTIFQRLHEKSKYPGTGIGLALCRKIVDNHGGMITAQSEENRGTTLSVILPEQQA